MAGAVASGFGAKSRAAGLRYFEKKLSNSSSMENFLAGADPSILDEAETTVGCDLESAARFSVHGVSSLMQE